MDDKIQFKGMLNIYLRWPLIVVAFMALCSIGMFIVSVKAGFFCLGMTLVVLLFSLFLYFWNRKRLSEELIHFAMEYGQVQKTLFMEMDIPYALLDTNGRILWMNRHFQVITGKDRRSRKNISSVFPTVAPEKLPKTEEPMEFHVTKDDAEYILMAQAFNASSLFKSAILPETDTDSVALLTVYLQDVTELNRYIRMNEEEKLVTGLVYIDNYEEALESVEDVRQSLLTALIERKINKYFMGVDAIVRKLEKDKYFIVMRQCTLDHLIVKKFDILEEVKKVNIGNQMAVTLSIGIGANAATFVQTGEYARAAIELALGRGGDQAVVKNDNDFTFYGGKSQHAEKTTRVKARVKAHALREIMNGKDRVLIMGHSLPDADALGAGIGVYVAARSMGKDAHIVINRATNSTQLMMDGYMKDPNYPEDLFVNAFKAKELVNKNTVLVVVDVNRPSYTECSELLSMVETIVVLDHHRRGNETIKKAALSYIEPYASSACEMVSEILQYFGDGIRIRNMEADSLYAGILLDTNYFMNKTGVRTFEAAAFLRRNGADISRIRKLFRENLADYQAKGTAIQNAEMFMEEFAISECPSQGIKNPTVVCAQAANDLLNVTNVKASFVLTEYDDKIFISARSIDEINVQIIMERLGGGGHINVAGAQLEDKTMQQARTLLKETLQEMKNGGDI